MAKCIDMSYQRGFLLQVCLLLRGEPHAGALALHGAVPPDPHFGMVFFVDDVASRHACAMSLEPEGRQCTMYSKI